MLREPHRLSLWIATFALAWGVGGMGMLSVGAQEPQTKPEAPPSSAPKEINSTDFAVEADAVQERLDRIRAQISVIDVVDQVRSELDSILTEGVALLDELTKPGSHRVMSSELNSLSFRLEALDDRCEAQIAKLTGYGDELEKLATQNDEDIKVWTQALQQAQRASMAKAAQDRTASILQGLHEGHQELQKKLEQVLGIQAQALDVRDRIRFAKQKVEVAQDAQVQSIYERQQPPLWQFNAELDHAAGPTGYYFHFSWQGFKHYLQESRELLILVLLLVVALGSLFSRMRALATARRAKHKETAAMAWEDRAIESLLHPWATALLLGLASMRYVEPERGIEMILVVWSAALPLWFLIYREMVPTGFQRALVGLVVLGVLHVVLVLVSNDPRVERVVLLSESSLVIAGSIWLVRSLRVAELPKGVRDGLWFFVTISWARLCVLLSAVALVAGVWGFTNLAFEAVGVAVMGTIGATAWIALARIAESVVSIAIYEGRLNTSRMIRVNRDLAAKTLRRLIRFAAALLFVWAMADMTSAWRPVGRALRHAVSADLGLGFAQIGLTFGDLLGFFIVLWASWIVSRFVSFVLREEVFLRLHMKAGVPYALTTFTRYAIIAIGFVAGVSVLGAPLDRITIVLSALGVGIGFGLQKFVSNVVSGFILLTERPFRLRDKIQIDDVLGYVTHIGIRASSIRTFEGADIIIPNDDLISGRLVNWTLSDSHQRMSISVGAAYGTDPSQVLTILRRVAGEHEKVLKSPAPQAIFLGFGDSSLNFELRVFMDSSDVFEVPSEIAVAINQAFAEAAITIPFPQRDLHLRSVAEGLLPRGVDAQPGGDDSVAVRTGVDPEE
jgi:small-conductance mechanosensitive channel